MFCHNCGANWPEGIKFCGKCGTTLETAVPVYTPPADEDATVAVRHAANLAGQADDERTVRVRQVPPVPAQPQPVAPVQQSAAPVAAPVAAEMPVAAPVAAEMPVAAPAVMETPVAEVPVMEPPAAEAPVLPDTMILSQEEQHPEPTVAMPQPRYAPQTPPRQPSRAIKPLSLVITLTMVFSMVLVLLSGVAMLGTNVSEMGAITWGMDLFYNFDLEDELEKLDDTRREISNKTDHLEGAQKKSAKKMEDQLEKVLDDNSITKLFTFGEYLLEQEDSEHFDLEEMDSLRQVVEMKTVIYIVIAALYLLPMLFDLIGGLVKSSAMSIVAMVLTLLVQLLFSTDLVLIIITMVLFVAQIVLCYIVKNLKAQA